MAQPETPWSPSGWREREAAQQPAYADSAAVEAVAQRIKNMPPLVFSGEVEKLKDRLAEVARGERFLLQGGDCAERFADCNSPAIVRKLKILLQMSLVLTYGARKPVLRLGRIAGQYAKPRSKPTEIVDGVEMGSYRGDIVSDIVADPAAREPDPNRLLEAYFHASTTLNFIRALVDGGFADLHHPEHWRLEFVPDGETRRRYEELSHRIRDAISYIEVLGGLDPSILNAVEFYTSHEGLLLAYEDALTQQPPRREQHYNLGAHFLWIGDRTRQLDGAHIEYFRGIANPIGVKVGPSADPDEVVRLCEALDPQREPGRLTLITRYGKERIGDHLPGHIRAVKAAGWLPVWSCDPMHGNTTSTGGFKTRAFDDILTELRAAFDIHEAEGGHLGGVHFELTGDNVTECVGGSQNITPEELAHYYETGCDPRLNYTQSLEMAFLIASELTGEG